MGLPKAGAWSPSQPADTTRAPASLSLGGQPVPPNLTQVPSVTSTTGRQGQLSHCETFMNCKKLEGCRKEQRTP